MVSDVAVLERRSWAYVGIAVIAWNVAMAVSAQTSPWIPMAVTGVGLSLLALLVVDLRPWLFFSLYSSAATALLLAAMLAATYGGYELTRSIPFIEESVRALYAWGGHVDRPRAVLLTIIVAAEEIIWRGAVLSVCVNRFGRWPGVVAMAAIYGLAHTLSGQPVLALVAVLCGAGWAVLRLFTGSLVAPFVAHWVWDLFILQWAPLTMLDG